MRVLPCRFVSGDDNQSGKSGWFFNWLKRNSKREHVQFFFFVSKLQIVLRLHIQVFTKLTGRIRSGPIEFNMTRILPEAWSALTNTWENFKHKIRRKLLNFSVSCFSIRFHHREEVSSNTFWRSVILQYRKCLTSKISKQITLKEWNCCKNES